jgi:endonuclease YncB( thermonuclease family)
MYEYRVIECLDVYDGDSYTLRIDVGFHLYTVVKVRLKGADTYELRGGTEQTKAFARAGRNFAKEWFSQRLYWHPKTVFVHTEKTDSFGRWLGTIYDDDGLSLAHGLVAAGLTTGRYE